MWNNADTWNKSYLMSRVGDISQIAGIRRYTLSDGMASGVEAADIRTGAGLNFTVLPGRGMDIAWADYTGIPLAFISQTGVTAPPYYEAEGKGWLRGFFGGLLTTCGLLNAGPSCEENHPVLGLRKHGQHGRIAHIPAENVNTFAGWTDDGYTMTVSGRMREACMFGENLTLTRTVTAKLGENRFVLTDTVENHAAEPSPLMLLYHFNFGYPLLDEGSELICDSAVTPRDEAAAKHIAGCRQMDKPMKGRLEEVFFHDLRPRSDGKAYAALVNRRLGLGAYLQFDKRELAVCGESPQ